MGTVAHDWLIMADYFIYNGQVFSAGDKIIGPTSRALRYGDGLFETLRMKQGRIPLADFHFDRLFRGLNTLQFPVPSAFNIDFLLKQIDQCASANYLLDEARVRLNVFRSEGILQSPTDNSPNFIIEATALDPAYTNLNAEGWTVDIYPHARKSCDLFSPLKHNNFQPYLMAALFANAHHLDDAIVLNQYERIADSKTANIFLVTNNVIITNPVEEGCVDGVLRRFLSQKMKGAKIDLCWKAIHIHDLLDADEVFLTNAVAQMRWVKQFRKKSFSNKVSKQLFQLLK